jgi:hypothetical protein
MTDRRAFLKHSSLAALGLGAVAGHKQTSAAPAENSRGDAGIGLRSIREFGVDPAASAAQNTKRLQAAIDWASDRGAALLVEPSDEPYLLQGGLVLRRNVSLVGVNGPCGRGTTHPSKPQPVGSVLATQDESQPLITVENGTKISGIQFWYPSQALRDPNKVIEYPPTIAASKQVPAQGVTLVDLSFFGEFTAMDFRTPPDNVCELVRIEHCFGYPLSGRFVMIDRCYDIPRLLHTHVNPANRRHIDGGYSQAIIDSVIDRGTFAYEINHTDNAQAVDVFTFGTYGGAYLGPATYGQMTNFNFDCVTIGIHKLGDNDKNRNWQIAQGSVIANTGETIEQIHPFVIEGRGHTALTNVEAFSGGNPALTNKGTSYDFLTVRGDEPLTVSLFGCRMQEYTAEEPFHIENDKATVQAVACWDQKHEQPVNFTHQPA